MRKMNMSPGLRNHEEVIFFSLRWLTVFLRLLTPPLLLFLLAGFQIQKPSVCGDC